jgi:hypothetical protein
MARVYSKTLEAKSKPLSAILLRAYEEHHGPITGHVVRVEFQLMPEALSEMVVPGDGSDVRDWDTFLWAVPSIWAYLTRHWLVLRAREHGYSRMRDAPVDPLWVLVQEAFCEGGGTPVVREKRLGAVDVVALARQALGAFMTAKVVAGVTASFERVWQAFFRRLGFEDGAMVYRQVEAKKLAKFGLMPDAYRFGGVPA